MGQKVSEIIARSATCPQGSIREVPRDTPEWMGPGGLGIFVEMLREVTDWRVHARARDRR